MPRKKPDSTEPGLPAERREVRRIAALLRTAPLTLKDYYNVGELARRLASEPSLVSRGSNWRQTLAGLVGCSASTLSKAMQFRDAYGAEDLPALEQLGVGWSRLTIALGVRDKRERLELLRQARDQKWSEQELQRVIQGRLGRRRGGGRPRRELRSHGVLADLAELAALTGRWLDFYDRVWSRRQQEYAGELPQLPDKARQDVLETLETVHTKLSELSGRGREAKEAVQALRREFPDEGR